MDIFFDNKKLPIEVDDDSYRYRAIKGEHSLTLHFSRAEHVEIPVGAWAIFEGERYELEQPGNFKKNGTRNFEYTLIMEAAQAKLKKYKFRNPVDKRLEFSYTARPHEHLQMLVDNMNLRESDWTVGECVDAVEKVISYNHAFCIDALGQMADEFNTEYEIVGKTIHLHKVEYNKSNPMPLSYGKGNGFRPGVGRSNFSNSKPVEVLFAQGGEDNIDPSKYGGKSLLLPRNATLRFDGTYFEDEPGFNSAVARRYVTDADGLSLRRADKELQTKIEDSLDCSHIYPRRVGTISVVEVVDADKNFYDIVDNSIPDDLDYDKCLMKGETMTVIFQSGMLAGKEFEVKYYHDAKGGKAARRFEIVPQEIDGETMPNETFKPVVGNTYAVFHIALPDAYICDNATKSGASWDMLREAVKYLYDNEEQKFTFKGELDGIWAKRDWINIGGRIKLGGYILFSDAQFQPEGVAIRIVGIKDYINRPHSPEIELSNETVGNSFTSQLNKIEETEVVIDDQYRKAVQFTKRRYRDSTETIEMLGDALLDNFSNSINPLAVQTMAMLVGDKSLQFEFVNNMTNPTPVNHNVTYNQMTKVLSVPAGIIQHYTLGIDTISSSHTADEYKFWLLSAFETPPLTDGDKKYYLYAKVSNTDQTGVFYISEKAIAMDDVAGYYHLLMGVLNSEYDGERSYASLYGFTEILPGRITTDKIVSSDGKTYFDLLQGIISGHITFKSGSSGLENLTEWSEKQEEINTAQATADTANRKAQEAKDYIEQVKREMDYIASDSSLTPSEKQQVTNEWTRIQNEYCSMMARAQEYKVPVDAFTAYFQLLENYITPLLSNMNVTSNIVGTEFRKVFDDYYDISITMSELLNEAEIEDIKSDYGYLTQAMEDGSTEVKGGLVMTNVLLLKNMKGEQTAGVSGLQDDGVPFWAGADYLNRKKAVFRVHSEGDIHATRGTIGILQVKNDAVEVSNTAGSGNKIILSPTDIKSVGQVINAAGIPGNRTTEAVSAITTSNASYVSDDKLSSPFDGGSGIEMSGQITGSIRATNGAGGSVKVELVNQTTGKDEIIYRQSTADAGSGNVQINEQVKHRFTNSAVQSFCIRVTVEASSSGTFGSSASVSVDKLTFSFKKDVRKNLIAPNGIAVVQGSTDYMVSAGNIFEVRLGQGGLKIENDRVWKRDAVSGEWVIM